MCPPKEHLDNIQLRNKRALDQTVCHKGCKALSHCPYQRHVLSRPHCLDVHQSAGFVADNFIGFASILQATSQASTWLDMPIKRCSFVDCLFALLMLREKLKDRLDILTVNLVL